MKVRCIRARVGVEVGDVVEVPDGAVVSPLYYEPVEDGPPASPAAAGIPVAAKPPAATAAPPAAPKAGA